MLALRHRRHLPLPAEDPAARYQGRRSEAQARLMYREYPPGPALAHAVECYWSSVAAAPAAGCLLHRVLPDGCMDLLFDLTAAAGGRTTIVGTMRRPLDVASERRTDLFGVRFRPGGLTSLLVVDAAELVDERADLACFAGRIGDDLWDRLAEAAPADRPAVAEAALQARLAMGAGVDATIRHCVAKIEAARGALSIVRLEAGTGLSGRQIERKFARHIGVSPKTFARIARFKALLAAAAEPGPLGWAALAADLGYADQPHLVREFRSFAGVTPTAYFGAQGVGFVQDGSTAPD
jgi:AraC-like DNA-binding protein